MIIQEPIRLIMRIFRYRVSVRGTSIKREAGKELSIDCTLEVTEGTAKVFWISGSDEAVTLIETTGTYSDTITLPDGGNYIGIECEDFTGNIELNIE